MSPFDEGEMELVRQWEVDDSLRSVPDFKTVERALGMLKNGKVAGSSGILPEMLKTGKGCGEFVDMLTEWANAILVPITKVPCTPVTIGGDSTIGRGGQAGGRDCTKEITDAC